jgi:hypothetical protein
MGGVSALELVAIAGSSLSGFNSAGMGGSGVGAEGLASAEGGAFEK